MAITTTTQTIAELHAEQMIVPDWMRELGKPTDLVRVTRKHTPFGVYVLHAERV